VVRRVPVLWVISGGQGAARCLVADPLELGIPVPVDVAALAGSFWGRGAVVLVTTRVDGIPADCCELLWGSVTEQEAVLVEAALAAMVS
jgi:hypothetical protein